MEIMSAFECFSLSETQTIIQYVIEHLNGADIIANHLSAVVVPDNGVVTFAVCFLESQHSVANRNQYSTKKRNKLFNLIGNTVF